MHWCVAVTSGLKMRMEECSRATLSLSDITGREEDTILTELSGFDKLNDRQLLTEAEKLDSNLRIRIKSDL